MKPVAVLYATREGQTRRIADRVADGLRKRGLEVAVSDVGAEHTLSTLQGYAAVVLASPVHAGRYAPEAVKFVKKHLSELQSMPNAFISVTLSEAGVELASATPEQRARSMADVEMLAQRFVKETGWQPRRMKHVAGALLYTKYNFLLRWIMKSIAKKSGGATDTSRDYEYTDWEALDQFVASVADDVGAAEAGRG